MDKKEAKPPGLLSQAFHPGKRPIVIGLVIVRLFGKAELGCRNETMVHR